MAADYQLSLPAVSGPPSPLTKSQNGDRQSPLDSVGHVMELEVQMMRYTLSGATNAAVFTQGTRRL